MFNLFKRNQREKDNEMINGILAGILYRINLGRVLVKVGPTTFRKNVYRIRNIVNSSNDGERRRH